MFKTADNAVIKFAGNIDLRTGTACKLIGEFIQHERWGEQFKVTTFEPDIMTDARGLAKYIADNPRLCGLGTVKAKRLVTIYGENLEAKLADPDQHVLMATLLGVGKETIKALAEEWEKDKHLITTKSWLAGFGLTNRQITKLIEKYDAATKQTLEDNPYLLVHEIDGWGFKRVDDVAQAMGYPKEHSARIRAAIIYCIKQEEKEGNCWVGSGRLTELANKTLYLDCQDSKKIIEAEVEAMIADGSLYFQRHQWQNDCVALPEFYWMEKFIFQFLQRANEENRHRTKFYDIVEKVFYDDLNGKQSDAFIMAMDKKISLITGGAGTGKTHTLKKIINLYDALNLSVICCALAGKAARRMTQLSSHPASTIHRLLEFDPMSGEFLRNNYNPIDSDLVIVDEFSMVDIRLAFDLFKAIDLNRTAVILVGDHNQLPSIGAGAILRDITKSNIVPKTILTEMMRQSGALERNSNKTLEGIVIRASRTVEDDPTIPLPWLTLDRMLSADDVTDHVRRIAKKTIQTWGEKSLMDLQVISPMRKGATGTNRLNRILQHLYQSELFDNPFEYVDGETSPLLLKYDKVIYCRNNRQLDLFNGTMGEVRGIDSKTGAVTVEWDDGRVIKIEDDDVEDIQLAYALTIHKTQGSEFPVVIVICYKQHMHMLHRNLLYTAVTRAQQSCVIIGDQIGIKIAAERVKQNDRNTFIPIFEKEVRKGLSESSL